MVDPLTGRPVAGARVVVKGATEGGRDFELRTDGAGRFRAEGLPRDSSPTLRVEAPGYAARRVMVYDGSDDITVSLSPASRVYGKVTDTEGNPVQGALVFVDGVYGYNVLNKSTGSDLRLLRLSREVPQMGFERTMKRRASAVTDAAGRFEAEGIPVAQSLTLVAWAEGFSPSEPRRDFVIPPGSAGESADLALLADTRVVMRIRMAGGADRPSEVSASVSTPFWPKPFVRQEDGSLQVGGIPAGRTWYLVEAPP